LTGLTGLTRLDRTGGNGSKKNVKLSEIIMEINDLREFDRGTPFAVCGRATPAEPSTGSIT
jgi:hypothetical protein